MIRAWDDDVHYEELIQSLLESERVPLLEARPKRGPAFYTLFLASTARRLTLLYADLALGADPIWVRLPWRCIRLPAESCHWRSGTRGFAVAPCSSGTSSTR